MKTTTPPRPSTASRKLSGLLWRLSVFLIAAGSLALVQTANATALFYEPFPSSYGDGTAFGSNGLNGTGTTWPGGNSIGAGNCVVSNFAALSYSGFTTTAGSYGLLMPTTSANRQASHSLGTQTFGIAAGNTTNLYASFLINVVTKPSVNRMFFSLASSTSGGSLASGLGVWVTSGGGLILSKNATTPVGTATADLTASTQPHLVVIRYKWFTGNSNDEMDLWLDPSAATFGNGEPGVPSATISTTSGTDNSSLISATMCHSAGTSPNFGAGAGTFYFDELRVGTNWADVTPPLGCTPAAVTTVSGSTSVHLGQTATFTVGGGGTSPTYQWQSDAGGGFTNISGATSVSFTTPATTAAEDGRTYKCVVTKCDTSTETSATFTLTVMRVAYRSVGSGGPWATPGTWETNRDGGSFSTATVAPTDVNSTNILIQSGSPVIIAATAQADDIVVASGAFLTNASGITFTVANGAAAIDCDVTGTLVNAGVVTTTGNLTFENGGKYQHNFTTAAGVIPTSTWASGSTCEIIGYSNLSGSPTGLGQAFHHFTYNCPNQTGAAVQFGGGLTTVNGNFTVTSTGADVPPRALRLGSTSSQTMTVGGNYVLNGGLIECASGGSGGPTINITGNLSITGGTNDLCTSSGATTIMNVTGNISVTGGGLKKGSGTAGNINLTGGGTHTFTSGGAFVGAIGWTVNSANTIDFGTSVLSGTGSTFTLGVGGAIITANTAGLDGSITVTGTKTLNAPASYTFNGASAQVTGTLLPATVSNLTLNNSSGLTLSSSTTVTNTLTLTSGKVFTGLNTLGVGQVANVTGVTSSKYVVGKLNKTFGTGAGQSFTFFVGDPANYTPVDITSMTVGTAGNLTASVTNIEHPDIASTTIDFNKSVNRYWTVTAGGGIVASTYDATFNYLAGDVDGLADPNNFIVGKSTGGSWTYPTVGTKTATSTQITGESSFSDFAIGEQASSSASKLSFTTQPVSTTAGVTLANVVVQIQNPFNANVASNNVPVTLTLSSGFLGGTVTKNTDVNGTATFDDLVITNAGTGKTLTAAASGIGTGLANDISDPFNITNAAAAKLLVNTAFTSPQSDLVNFAPSAVVRVVDQYNNLVNSNAVIDALLSTTDGSGTVAGTSQTTASAGTATFSAFQFSLGDHNVAENVELYFSTPGLTPATNASVLVNPVFTPFFQQQPTAAQAGVAISPAITVAVSNAVNTAADGVAVNIQLIGTGTLSGTTPQTSTGGGIATFNDLSVNVAGTGKQLRAYIGTRTNLSSTFDITAGALNKLQILAPGETNAPGSGKVGTPISQATDIPFNVVILGVDQFWNVTASSDTVGVTSSDNSATLPANAALVAGRLTNSVTLATPGSQTVTATNITNPSITSDTSTITVVLLPRYRSKQAGNWSDFTTWQVDTGSGFVDATSGQTPTSADGTITIRNGHAVTNSTSVTADQLTIEATGTNVVNTTVTLTIADGPGTDMSVSGTVINQGTITPTGTVAFQNGGLYRLDQNSGAIVTATWNVGSTCEITGFTSFSGAPAGMGQAFHHFTFNSPALANNNNFGTALQTVNGNLTFKSFNTRYQKLAGSTSGTLYVGGDFIVDPGAGGRLSLDNSSGTQTVNLKGSLIIASGRFSVKDTATAGGILNISNNLYVAAGATLDQTTAGGTHQINFAGTTSQLYTNLGTVSDAIDWTVNNGSVVDVGTSVISGTAGTFTLSASAGIKTAHASGLDGNITVTGAKTFNTAADYTYNGVVAQATGALLPATVNNLTFTNAAGVTLNATETVSGTCTVAVNTLLLGTGTVNGTMAINGTLNPATASTIGTFTASAPTLSGTLSNEINRAAGPVLTADKLVRSSGTLAFGGTLSVTTLAGSQPLAGGETFDLFDASAFSGSFAATNLPTLGAGLNWYTANLGVNGTINVNRAPVANADNFSKFANQMLKIARTSLTNNDTDGDLDTLTYTFDPTTTQGITLLSDADYIYYTNTAAVSDSFNYSISDGRGGTASGAVNITITTQTSGTNSVVSIQVNTPVADVTRVTFAGIPGTNYVAQRATNAAFTGPIREWTTNAPVTGLFTVDDDFNDVGGPPAPPQAYYRLKYIAP